MNKFKFLLWLIGIVVVFSMLVDLPENYRLKLNVGSWRVDRLIHNISVNFQIGSLSVRKKFSTHYGLDLSGGTHLVMEADMTKIATSDRDKAFASARDVVERRVNLYGLTEPVIQQAKVGGSYRIIVEIPGISNMDQAVDLIGKTAQLSFNEESSPSGREATPSSLQALWSKPTGLTGKNLKRSTVDFDRNTSKPVVTLEFDSEGTKLFADITKRNVGKTIAMLLDNQFITQPPRVSEPINDGKAIIQGSFTLDEAKHLSIALNAGALPAPLTVIEQRNIGATLGQESINKSLFAGIIGLCIIALFMIINYGFLGVIADIALIIYSIIVLALFKTVPVTLTLAGIAGFILSIGMAVDANILIFERMKEERRWGKSYLTAITLGFDRAFPSIRDSNISSLITCSILYWFGSGMVRGFAITLAVGILASLFTAITVTKTFLRMIYK